MNTPRVAAPPAALLPHYSEGTPNSMTIELNHTLVHAKDTWAAAREVAGVLGLAEPTSYGPFAVLQLDNGATLDFIEDTGEITGPALRVPGRRGRLRRDLGPDPGAGPAVLGRPVQEAPQARSTTSDGGRGLYWEGPDGHWLEIITRPYGSGGRGS